MSSCSVLIDGAGADACADPPICLLLFLILLYVFFPFRVPFRDPALIPFLVPFRVPFRNPALLPLREFRIWRPMLTYILQQ